MWSRRKWFSLLLAMCVSSATYASAAPAEPDGAVAGVWACQSISAGAFTGRPCRFEPWLRLTADFKYEWGREQGTWSFADQTLTLSGRKGKGRLNEDGKLIYEYEQNGKQYVLTLYKRPE